MYFLRIHGIINTEKSPKGGGMAQVESEERKIRFIEANMKLEGFHISEKSVAECKRILKKEASGDEIVRACICRYKKESE
jgi:hypothetical protein